MVILVSRLRLTQITGPGPLSGRHRDLKEKWLFSKKFDELHSSTLGAVESPVLIAEHTASGPRYGPNQKGGRTMAKRGSLVYQINQELQSQLRIARKRGRRRLLNIRITLKGSSATALWRSTRSNAAALPDGPRKSMAAARWTICDSACRNTSSVK